MTRALAQLPNALTSVRLLFGLAFPALPSEWWLPVAGAAALSEALDGPLARRLGAVTTLGTYLDPIADKVFVFSALCTLALHDLLSPLDLFLVILRDLTVVGGVMWATARKDFSGLTRMLPLWSGKFATFCQLSLLLALFVLKKPLPALVYFTAAISAFAGVDYVQTFLRRER